MTTEYIWVNINTEPERVDRLLDEGWEPCARQFDEPSHHNRYAVMMKRETDDGTQAD